MFYIPVANLVEAKLLLYALEEYDHFQYINHIKGNYCNAGGLQVWHEENQEWDEWWDDSPAYDGSWLPRKRKYPNDIREYSLEELRDSYQLSVSS
jgi:hypothetical protein